MCTLTWFETDGGYQLFFNRDERRSRLPGIEPAPRQRGSTRYVAPLDGNHGGTWIAVSENGLSACLLNGFASTGEPPPPGGGNFVSRGFLVPSVIEAPSTAAALRRLETTDLSPFQPFMLALFEPDHPASLARWNGTALEIDEHTLREQPLVSSSFYTEEVRASRTEVLKRVLGRPAVQDRAELHLAYHESHQPHRGPYSPCMHREDARTVSFSRIDVDPARVSFHYTSNPPCRGLPHAPAVELPRP